MGSWQTLKVYAILGNELATLIDEFREAGKYQVNFDASRLSSCVYSQDSGRKVGSSKKILLLK